MSCDHCGERACIVLSDALGALFLCMEGSRLYIQSVLLTNSRGYLRLAHLDDAQNEFLTHAFAPTERATGKFQ